jgi:hypothetical protein
MSAKEIKELRLAGKLPEALAMAEKKLSQELDNIWAKRNLSWVNYAYAKQHLEQGQFELYLEQLEKIKAFDFSIDEVFLFESLTWLNGKMCFYLLKYKEYDVSKVVKLWNAIKGFHYTKSSQSYSFLYKGFHKAFKDTIFFLDFAEWWGFEILYLLYLVFWCAHCSNFFIRSKLIYSWGIPFPKFFLLTTGMLCG